MTQLIDALYSGAVQCQVSTEVTFEDGKKGTIDGDIRIEDIETYQPLKEAS